MLIELLMGRWKSDTHLELFAIALHFLRLHELSLFWLFSLRYARCHSLCVRHHMDAAIHSVSLAWTLQLFHPYIPSIAPQQRRKSRRQPSGVRWRPPAQRIKVEKAVVGVSAEKDEKGPVAAGVCRLRLAGIVQRKVRRCARV